MKRLIFVSALLALAACAAPTAATEDYDPDADADVELVGGKADGIFDIIPEIAFDEEEGGTVFGDDIEFYRIDLQRTDVVTVRMYSTNDDFNPHISFYRGTNTYVRADDWGRHSNGLSKTYTASDDGTFLIAARVYRRAGGGDYTITVQCNDGPCDGNFPDATDTFAIDDVEECFEAAQQCAIAALPAYNGRVGVARAASIIEGCFAEVSTSAGDSCASVCEWENPNDSDDRAQPVCDALAENLPWFADQNGECMAEHASCFADCLDAYAYGYALHGEFEQTAIAICLDSGIHNTCNGYARNLTVCDGGDITPDTAGSCELLCQSTLGAFIDDTSDVCGEDAVCWEYDLCEVDIELAGDACGGVTIANEDCLNAWLTEHHAYACGDALGAIL